MNNSRLMRTMATALKVSFLVTIEFGLLRFTNIPPIRALARYREGMSSIGQSHREPVRKNMRRPYIERLTVYSNSARTSFWSGHSAEPADSSPGAALRPISHVFHYPMLLPFIRRQHQDRARCVAKDLFAIATIS